MGCVAGEAELVVHELVPDLVGGQGGRQGGLLGREGVAGQGGNDHGEGIAGLPTVLGGGGQAAGQVSQLQERAGPAVGQHDRQGVGILSVESQEVHGRPVDGGHVGGQGVEGCFLRAPVEVAAPDLHEPVQLGGVGAGLPARGRPRDRPPGAPQPGPQVLQVGLGHLEHEPLLGHDTLRRTPVGKHLVAGVARKLAVPIPTTPGPSQPASVGVMGSVMAQSRPGDEEKPSPAAVRIPYGCPEARRGGRSLVPSMPKKPSTFRLRVGCSASIWSAPDGSSLLTLDALVGPDGSRRIQKDRLDDPG